jgi:hypothetical protein
MMKSLLRKKGTPDNHQRPSPPPVQNAPRQRSTIETPLYARFASVHSGLPPQERVLPVVSGPMPLGRHNRTNLETEENRRRHDETALLTHARQETPPATWSPSGFLPSDVQLTADKPHQPARVILTQASRQPIKAQMTCKSSYSLVPVRSKVASFIPSRSHWRSPKSVLRYQCILMLIPFNHQHSQTSCSLLRNHTTSLPPKMYTIPVTPSLHLPSLLGNPSTFRKRRLLMSTSLRSLLL